MISVIHPITNSSFGGVSNHHHRAGGYYNHPAMATATVDSMISFQNRSRGYTHHVASQGVLNWGQQQEQHQQQSRAVNQQSSRSSSSLSISTSASKLSGEGPIQKKDFSKPLFVDCSIEYELPNAPKIPKNSLPILMIHPGFIQDSAKKVHQQQRSYQQQAQQQKICSVPNCQCKIKAGSKRSYSNAMNGNNSNNDFYQQHLQQQQQQQKNIAG